MAYNAAIAAVVGGAGVCILLLLFVVIILLKKVKRQRERIDMTADEIHEFMQGITAEKANAKGINGLFVLPYDKTLEILKSDVTFGKTYSYNLHLRCMNINLLVPATLWIAQ